MDSKTQAVLTALVYSDLISFPLTLREVKRYLGPGGEALRLVSLRALLQELSPLVREQEGYYYLAGNEGAVAKRKVGKRAAQRKIKLAEQTVRLLRLIPTIRFIGLSGTVGAGSAEQTDDIDLFIVTKHQCLFVTRFLVLIVLQLTGQRRRRQQHIAADTICANFFLDEHALAFPPVRHDLYTGREIAQLVPLLDREQTYRRLFTENSWLTSLLPHVRPQRLPAAYSLSDKFLPFLEWLLCFPLWEVLLMRLQLRVITAHRTTETVSDQVLAFHPQDHRRETLRRFRRRFRETAQCLPTASVRQEKIPLRFLDNAENIFYTA
jgi:hypothetical protein